MPKSYKTIPYSVRQLEAVDFARVRPAKDRKKNPFDDPYPLHRQTTFNRNSNIVIHLGLFRDESLVAWGTGYNIGFNVFYLDDSVSLVENDGGDSYSRLTQAMIDAANDEGFHSLKCHHSCCASEVIALRLKMGFAITGLEITESRGPAIVMEYYINKKRYEILRFRNGESRPNAWVRKILKL